MCILHPDHSIIPVISNGQWAIHCMLLPVAAFCQAPTLLMAVRAFLEAFFFLIYTRQTGYK
jgi:hypothetical protein